MAKMTMRWKCGRKQYCGCCCAVPGNDGDGFGLNTPSHSFYASSGLVSSQMIVMITMRRTSGQLKCVALTMTVMGHLIGAADALTFKRWMVMGPERPSTVLSIPTMSMDITTFRHRYGYRCDDDALIRWRWRAGWGRSI